MGPTIGFPLDLFGGERRTVEEKKAYLSYQRYELDAAYLSLTAHVVAEALALAIADEKKRRKLSAIRRRCDRLTQREREVMNFLIRGDSSRKLAERLGLSSRTVEIHRSKIMRKLEAGSLPDLVRMVCSSGGFQPEEFLVDITESLLRKDEVG